MSFEHLSDIAVQNSVNGADPADDITHGLSSQEPTEGEHLAMPIFEVSASFLIH